MKPAWAGRGLHPVDSLSHIQVLPGSFPVLKTACFVQACAKFDLKGICLAKGSWEVWSVPSGHDTHMPVAQRLLCSGEEFWGICARYERALSARSFVVGVVIISKGPDKGTEKSPEGGTWLDTQDRPRSCVMAAVPRILFALRCRSTLACPTVVLPAWRYRCEPGFSQVACGGLLLMF